MEESIPIGVQSCSRLIIITMIVILTPCTSTSQSALSCVQ